MKVRFFALFFFLISFFIYEELFASTLSKKEALKLFTDANEKYQQAAKLIAAKNNQEADQKLHDAALQYEAILANGFKHGQIYYNLGNTYYRKGELGKAIVSYRRAQRFMPRNADVGANLKLVKNAIEDKELSHGTPVVIQRIFFWLFLLNQNELILTAVSLYAVLMVLLFSFIILKYPWFKKIIIGFTAGLCIVVISLGIKIYREQGIHRGVIIAKKCQVLYGPGKEYEPKFEIHDGAECIVEAEKDGWYKVYMYVGIKQDAESKAGMEEKVSKDVRRGWLQKGDIDSV